MLNITVPTDLISSGSAEVSIYYETNANQTATSWVTKAQTACHTMEYLYTQCEDIGCRSVAPMQDTPSNRITYDANVIVPMEFDARMSGNRTGEYYFNDTHKVY